LNQKRETYARLATEIAAVIDGETSAIARYATAVCLLSEAFDHYYWTGFYLVDPQKPGELVIGPYQGTLGCLRIPFGKGVCGTVAKSGQTLIVDDVHTFPGHIACDSQTKSEIVVPVFDKNGTLAAVLDIDSTRPAAFDEDDKTGLETICKSLLQAN